MIFEVWRQHLSATHFEALTVWPGNRHGGRHYLVSDGEARKTQGHLRVSACKEFTTANTQQQIDAGEIAGVVTLRSLPHVLATYRQNSILRNLKKGGFGRQRPNC